MLYLVLFFHLFPLHSTILRKVYYLLASALAKCTYVLAANHMTEQMSQMNPNAAANPFGPGQDPDKLFLAEAENLEVMEHYCILDGIEERLLQRVG